MIHPGARVNTHKPRTEWWVESVFFDGVVITVSSEDLEKRNRGKYELVFGRLVEFCLNMTQMLKVYNKNEIRFQSPH